MPSPHYIVFIAGFTSCLIATASTSAFDLDLFRSALQTDVYDELSLIAKSQIEEHQERDASPYKKVENLWRKIIQHSWAKLDRGSSRQPFVTCTQSKRAHELLVGRRPDDAPVSSSQCRIQTLAVPRARELYDNNDFAICPLIDIAKFNHSTIIQVSSNEWVPPFLEPDKARDDDFSTRNRTELASRWERIITVDFVPGVEIATESKLLKVVNSMIDEIQDQAESGWFNRLDDREKVDYVIDESLRDTPALNTLFSLTNSSLFSSHSSNRRTDFWDTALSTGMESEGGCRDMFKTLFVKPRAGYKSYELVLNPLDGPIAESYNNSASNPACAVSLIAALSTHPLVLSIDANFPVYAGWEVARKIDMSS